jgi:hypothetical protein
MSENDGTGGESTEDDDASSYQLPDPDLLEVTSPVYDDDEEESQDNDDEEVDLMDNSPSKSKSQLNGILPFKMDTEVPRLHRAPSFHSACSTLSSPALTPNISSPFPTSNDFLSEACIQVSPNCKTFFIYFFNGMTCLTR